MSKVLVKSDCEWIEAAVEDGIYTAEPQPTPELRWCGGKLQQLWRAEAIEFDDDLPDGRVHRRHAEWRDVPMVDAPNADPGPTSD